MMLRPRAVSLFQSGLVRGVHARASGEAARRAKRGRVSRFARRTTEKRETARSLGEVSSRCPSSLNSDAYGLAKQVETEYLVLGR